MMFDKFENLFVIDESDKGKIKKCLMEMKPKEITETILEDREFCWKAECDDGRCSTVKFKLNADNTWNESIISSDFCMTDHMPQAAEAILQLKRVIYA